MNPIDFVLAVIHAFGDAIEGRTLLQKRCYFIALHLGKDNEYEFRAHYYGPYSPTIDSALTQLQAVGFIEESSIGFGAADSSGFEIRRHDYRLTPDGREIAEMLEASEPYQQILQTAQKIKEAGDPNYFAISIAAKASYILRSQGRPMTEEEIRKEATRFGWQIDQQALERAITFLERMDVARRNQRPGASA
jgi:uncharacterized protein